MFESSNSDFIDGSHDPCCCFGAFSQKVVFSIFGLGGFFFEFQGVTREGPGCEKRENHFCCNLFWVEPQADCTSVGYL